jgi:hypothetical protein
MIALCGRLFGFLSTFCRWSWVTAGLLGILEQYKPESAVFFSANCSVP